MHIMIPCCITPGDIHKIVFYAYVLFSTVNYLLTAYHLSQISDISLTLEYYIYIFSAISTLHTITKYA